MLSNPYKPKIKMDLTNCARKLLVLQILVVASRAHYLNQWAVEVDDDKHIEDIAKDTGCENKGKHK